MKKFVAVVCAAALALALSASAAFAVDSSEVITTTPVAGANGTTLSVTGTYWQLHVDHNGDGEADCNLIITPSSVNAGNIPAGTNVLASYEIYYDDQAHAAINGGGSVTVNLGCSYANYNFTCYIEHTDGLEGQQSGDTFETATGVTDAAGNATVQVSRLSIYTFVIGDKVGTAVDSGATSPKTGMDLGLAGGIAVIALVGTGVAFAARRKVSA